jgi:phospholipase C
MRRCLGLLLLMGLLPACGPTPPQSGNPAGDRPGNISPTTPTTGARGHVFVIVMENKSFEQAMSGRYTASLAARFAVLTNYHAVAHPSAPNYLALTSGKTWGLTSDAYRRLPRAGVGDQLTAAGVQWRAYMEGLTGDCFSSPYPYALKHNPFAYYGGQCPANLAPLSQLQTDLASDRPGLSWITPDSCHSMHDCPVATGDAWLARVVPGILASPAWQHNGLLLITWDEDDGSSSNNQVATLVIAPNLQSHQSATYYDHYSLLATVEDRLGVARLGKAAAASPITGLFRAS